MIIGVSEGDRTRFEVLLMSDGFIVRARCLETGELFGSRDRLFRTAPAAFAFAEKSALKEAEDLISDTGMEALEAKMVADQAARVFEDIRKRLGDAGIGATLLHAWDHAAQQGSARAMHS